MQTLCSFQDIEDNGAMRFETGGRSVVVVKKDGQIYVYVNSCPHIGIDLEFQENQFLDMDKQFIQCANHGALFEIETGLCISGPCHGQSLQAVDFAIEEDLIVLKETPDA